MINKIDHKFKGMMKDLAKESFGPEYYYDAWNIKLAATDKQSTLAIANERGTSLEFVIPIINSINIVGNNLQVGFTQQSGITSNSPLIYDGIHPEVRFLNITNINHKIIAYDSTSEFIVVVTTNDVGVDCIWKLTYTDSWNVTLVYINNLGLSSSNPPQVKIRYDNDNFIKLYLTDYQNQLRHILLTDDFIHNLESSFLDVLPEMIISQPKVTEKLWGGLHTSGMIQYAYNLYNLKGSQTKLSPVSELVPLSTSRRGGDVNEVVGQTNKIEIDNIDLRYDSIKVYSIKYNSYNQDPLISVIVDERITDDTAIFFDDGKPLYDISLEELIFLGGDPIYAKTLESKYNRLFLANYKTGHFDLPDFDARAYSYNIDGICRLKDDSGNLVTYTSPQNQVPLDADAINPDLNVFIYRRNAVGSLSGNKVVRETGLGGTGKNVTYYIYQKSAAELENAGDEVKNKFLKARETYRIAIEFYNRLGQTTLPKWIADFKAPHGNINGFYNILEVGLSAAAIQYLLLNGVVGWRVLRAKRDVTDMTVLCQGLINPTIFQITNKDIITSSDQSNQGELFEDHYLKLPSNFTRMFNPVIEDTIVSGESTYNLVLNGIKNGKGAFTYRRSNDNDNSYTEIYTDASNKRDNRRHLTYIYSKLFNLYSPEILFNESFNLEASVYMNPIGTFKNNTNKGWGRMYSVNNRQVVYEYKNQLGLSTFKTSGRRMHDYGLIGQAGRGEDSNTEFYQYYRKFSGFVPSYNINEQIELLDLPKYSNTGQAELMYNSQSELRFWNSLYTLITDDKQSGGIGLNGVNSQGVRTLVFAEKNLRKLENLYKDGITTYTTTGLPIAELTRVLPNQYGGNSYEARKRTEYLRIGDYNSLSTVFTVIENPGDVFVQNFRFARILPISKDTFDTRFTQYTEIVEFPVETTVDLKNRKDASNNEWDAKFQPTDEELHNYNNVYSQQADWNITRDFDYTFEEVREFPNAILATKVKTDNELIDSWTNILYNEEMKLDGSYGQITKLVSHNDIMVAFQPKAVALISIQPRVQTIAEDGIAIELGTGSILHQYKYLTTKNGSSNKYAILSSQAGLFFYDALANSLNILGEGKVDSVSKGLGFHTYFQDNINIKDAKIDNPFLNTGILLVEDDLSGKILFISKTSAGSFTLGYSTEFNTFTSFYNYNPAVAINYKNMFLTNNGRGIHSHYTGDYNRYYGMLYPSSITLLSNPGTNDNIFNFLEYRSECYKGTTEHPNITFNTIRAYNEYQDSTTKNLVINKNIFRKFRNWRITVPRDSSLKLDRIRGPWSFFTLSYTPDDNQKFICHNISMYLEDASIKQ